MNLSKSFVDLSLTGRERAKERLKKCSSCAIMSRPFWRCERNRSENGKSGCGCFVKAKSKMPNRYCPLSKWENGTEPKE